MQQQALEGGNDQTKSLMEAITQKDAEIQTLTNEKRLIETEMEKQTREVSLL